jgi:predicted Zn-dependent protease
MVTKAKAKQEAAPQAAPKAAGPHPLAEEFAKAIKQLEQGKASEAAKALEGLVAKAHEQGQWHLKRSAQSYLNLALRQTTTPKETKLTAEAEAQLLLNRKDAKGALALLDKALKAQPQQAKLHYLKAVALAQLEQDEPCAASLKTALELDADLTYLFRMEPDFEDMRDHPAFGFALGR